MRPHLPWVSLYCSGFPHAPITFGIKEHCYGTNGDNSYVIVLSPDLQCLSYQILGSNKMVK